ncbi:arginine-trna- transferase 1 [Pyrrhoderma noxium]|uniref:Arginyl-tRNA--protein transferase 1 n=1 Tax=Pyrrhoderma noxium TaxID=2282107 RepID=A0A286UNM3_9AGAM|nr:arginine-trna- transferase 1 [Pyrrhoderma noxium]
MASDYNIDLQDSEMEPNPDSSVLELYGYQSHTCGYCSPPGQRSEGNTSHSVGLSAISLTCEDYQMMIDRGWRRSGTYCYKPDMQRTCCPQYTIRLDTKLFTPTKKQRKVASRWNRYILDGSDDNELDDKGASKNSKKPRKLPPFSLIGTTHASEASFINPETPPKHKFEVELEPASFTDEKFNLYRCYQKNIHKEELERSPNGFKRFLVLSPLKTSKIVYEKEPPTYLPREYGSYHQLYRVDGKLIAIAVLDILPSCVSSVYFMYDNAWEKFSLGKLSALREASLTREMAEYGAKDMNYLYMGYYIHSCQKMRYKGDYSPSFLLDPETYSWFPLKDCIKLLEQYTYACFAHPDHSSLKSLKSSRSNSSSDNVSEVEAGQSQVLIRGIGALPLSETNVFSHPYLRDVFLEAITNLGLELSNRVLFTV